MPTARAPESGGILIGEVHIGQLDARSGASTTTCVQHLEVLVGESTHPHRRLGKAAPLGDCPFSPTTKQPDFEKQLRSAPLTEGPTEKSCGHADKSSGLTQPAWPRQGARSAIMGVGGA